MAWLKFDDGVPLHPKLLKAGHVASWLWFAGVCYSRRHLTDGMIPREVLAGLAPTIKKPLVEVKRLVEVGLWHETPDGWRVHDFHDWNPTRSDVESERKADRERKRNNSGILPEPSRVGAGVSVSPSDSPSDSGCSTLERARENLSPIHGRRNPDLLTYGPVKLWASQFRDEIVPLVATHYGGDRDAAYRPALSWVGELDEANQLTTPSRDVLTHPAKWWTDRAAERWGVQAVQSAPQKWCEHEPECVTQTEHTRRWLDETKAAHKAAKVSA